MDLFSNEVQNVDDLKEPKPPTNNIIIVADTAAIISQSVEMLGITSSEEQNQTFLIFFLSVCLFVFLCCVIALQSCSISPKEKSSQQISRTATETFHYYLSANKKKIIKIIIIKINLYKIMMATE
jgi:uncharacterized membrane protein SpoIIM required for sporulation